MSSGLKFRAGCAQYLGSSSSRQQCPSYMDASLVLLSPSSPPTPCPASYVGTIFIIKKFGHADYKMLQNIDFWELPLRMEGDSDEDSDDDGTDSNPEWPSAALNRGRSVQASIENNGIRHKVIADWIATK